MRGWHRPAVVPTLAEQLESRTFLSTVFWDGQAGDGIWQNPLNWSGDVLPGPSDDVIVSVPGLAAVRFFGAPATVRTVRSREDLQILAGQLTVSVNARVEAGQLTVAPTGTLRVNAKMEVLEGATAVLTSGRIDGPGHVRVWGSMTWSGGVLAGNGVAYVEDGANLAIAGNDVRLERRLVNRGAIAWTGRSITIASGFILNDSGGAISVEHEYPVSVISGAGGGVRFHNRGVVQVDVPTQTVTYRQVRIDVRSVTYPDSRVQVLRGDLWFMGGGVFFGDFYGDQFAGTTFSGTSWFDQSTSFNTSTGTAVSFDGGTHTLLGSCAWGKIRVSMKNNAFVHVADNHVYGSLWLAGTLSGPGEVVIQDDFHWSSGTLAGSGRLIVTTAADATMNGDAMRRLKRDLDIEGTCSGVRNLVIFDSTLDVHAFPGANGSAWANAWFAGRIWGGGAAQVVNHRLMHPHGAVFSRVRFVNLGTVDFFGGGRFQLKGAGTVLVDSGTIDLGGYGRLVINGDFVKTGGALRAYFGRPSGGATANGRVVVAGRAEFGGHLQAVFDGAPDSWPLIGDSFVFLWAQQRVGDVGGVTQLSPTSGFSTALVHTTHSAILRIEPG